MGRNPLSIQVCFNSTGRKPCSPTLFPRRNPLSIQVCFNEQNDVRTITDEHGRNPLSIQVCFNEEVSKSRGRLRRVVIPYQFRSVSIRLEGSQADAPPQIVVIPYQFRSVSINWCWTCFHSRFRGVVIPYQFRSVSMRRPRLCARKRAVWGRNPLSIQVCFNDLTGADLTGADLTGVVIPYQFRSVSIVWNSAH